MPSSKAAKVEQVVSMGVSRAKAEAALAERDDVSEAVEQILSGKYDHVIDDDSGTEAGYEDSVMGDASHSDEDGASNDGTFEDASFDGSIDFGIEDTDFNNKEVVDNDPYAGLSMSKDREVDVVELVEEPVALEVLSSSMIGGPLEAMQVSPISSPLWLQGCPEGNENSHLFSLWQKLSEPKSCPSCYKRHEVENEPYSDLLLLWPTFEAFCNYLQRKIQVSCIQCQHVFCLACGEPVKDAGRLNATDSIDYGIDDRETYERTRQLLHCGEAQSCVIGVGLIQLSREFPTDDVSSEESTPDQKSSEEVDDVAQPSATTSAKQKSGTGYGGDAADNNWRQLAGQEQRKSDGLLRTALEAIRNFLPTTSRANDHRGTLGADFLPHFTTVVHIRRRFLPFFSNLIRNTSLVDMLDRRPLFEELFEWQNIFSRHEALCPLMAQPIMIRSKVKYQTRGTTQEKHVTFKGSAGPRELLQEMVVQCNKIREVYLRSESIAEKKWIEEQKEAALALAEVLPDGHDDMDARREEEQEAAKARMSHAQALQQEAKQKSKEHQKLQPLERGNDHERIQMLKLCEELVEVTGKIDAGLRATKGDAFVDRIINPVNERARLDGDEKSIYEHWAYECRMDDVDMSKPGDSSVFYHVFNDLVRRTSENPSRTFLISKELTGLGDQLPSTWGASIWVRRDEQRVDIVKVCMSGPDDAPYASGLFCFDCFFDEGYNRMPPKIKIITTSAGKVRFNPNLYADGKVCLSLLGTWSGPGWISGGSTFLQVLISIQSMILGAEETIMNEPGYENHMGSPASRRYVLNNRRQTVAVAMLENLKTPPFPWKEVIEGHFIHKGSAIIAQLDQWLKEDDRCPMYGDGVSGMHSSAGAAAPEVTTQFEKDVAEVKRIILELQAAHSEHQAALAMREAAGSKKDSKEAEAPEGAAD